MPKLNRNCLLGGSVEVLEHLNFITTKGLNEHLRGKGYEFDEGHVKGRWREVIWKL